MIAEPAEPEVDAARLTYRRAFAEVFEKLIRAGISSGEFPAQNAAASAACVMGALSEGLIGPLAPEAPDLADNRALVEAIVCFCLQAVAASPCPSSPGPSSRRTRSFRVVESKR
jgi:hypothetical protein